MGDRLAELVARGGVPRRHGLRRHPDRPGRAHRDRSPRRRDPAAAPDREPLVALPGDDGRHHRLGALGQHARGRLGEPGRDDLVQPLRLRGDRRLAAPGRWPASPPPRRATVACGCSRTPSTAWTGPAREHETPYGRAASGWERVDGSVVVTAVVPPGTTAVVRLPVPRRRDRGRLRRAPLGGRDPRRRRPRPSRARCRSTPRWPTSWTIRRPTARSCACTGSTTRSRPVRGGTAPRGCRRGRSASRCSWCLTRCRPGSGTALAELSRARSSASETR